MQLNASGATVSLASMLVPQKARSAFEQADKVLTQHNLEEAQNELNKSISIYPKFGVAWRLMGVLHEEQLQLDEAFADYSQALEKIQRYWLPTLDWQGSPFESRNGRTLGDSPINS